MHRTENHGNLVGEVYDFKDMFYPEDSGPKRFFSLLYCQNSGASENTSEGQAEATTQHTGSGERTDTKVGKNNTRLQGARGKLATSN